MRWRRGIQLLLAAGADRHSQNEYGHSPLEATKRIANFPLRQWHEPRAEPVDPDRLQQLARALVAAEPPDWTEVCLCMFYEAPDVYGVRSWTTRLQQARTRTRPPRAVFLGLAALRADRAGAGQEPWQRCDLRVTRTTPGADPELSVTFAYEVGEVPE